LVGEAEEALSAGASERVGIGYLPRKRGDVLALDMGDGVILYNHDSSLVHHLNQSASIVWHLCDGDADGSQLAGEIAEEYGLDRDAVAAHVEDLIQELDALGLIEDAGHPEERDAPSERRVSAWEER
jgi:PqqD family protein of HPr-rel-A system